jgi:SAM-dependent methyltransferase
MADLPNRGTFESAYAGMAPWDIGRPQGNFVAVAERVSGAVLDCGCGTGDNALFFAERGHAVTGIDFLEEPIRRAKVKAAERGLPVNFLVMDALALAEIPQQYETILDCGLFHVFSDTDRARYVTGLGSVLISGGRLFLLCFSDAEPGTKGPRRVSRGELEQAFAEGWQIESIKPTLFEIRSDAAAMGFSPGGPKAWFANISRM